MMIILHYTIWLGVDAGNFSAKVYLSNSKFLPLHPLSLCARFYHVY
jgi:hypothetical protein